MIKRILVVGGANGIGLAIAQELAQRDTTEKVYVVDKTSLQEQYFHPKIESFQFNLTTEDYTFFSRFDNINAIMITSGFGKLALFKDVQEQHIIDSFNVNTIPVLRLIHRFYKKLENKDDFYCGVMVSIAGFMSSPFFAVYGATKAALKIFIESVNVELKKMGSTNCILNVSPGSMQGTSFAGGPTDLAVITPLAKEVIKHLQDKDDLFIPQYTELFNGILDRYYSDFRAEGNRSYDYKLKSGRVS